MPLLEIKDLSVCYREKPVFQHMNLTVESGEIIAITGASGCGKSTLLGAVMGILPREGVIQNGSIRYDGTELTSLEKKEYRKLRGSEIGMIFQNTGSSLNPVRTIGAQLYESVRAHKKCTKKEVHEKALAMMEELSLSDGERILKSYPFELSGGMNQRVGILLSAIMEPRLLLADEPTSALDEASQQMVFNQLLTLRERNNTAIVVVTHDLHFAECIADRIYEIPIDHCEAYKE